MNNEELKLEQVEDTMNWLRTISDGDAPEEIYLAMQDEGLMVLTHGWVVINAETMNYSVNKGVVIGTAGTLICLGAMKWLRKIL